MDTDLTEFLSRHSTMGTSSGLASCTTVPVPNFTVPSEQFVCPPFFGG